MQNSVVKGLRKFFQFVFSPRIVLLILLISFSAVSWMLYKQVNKKPVEIGAYLIDLQRECHKQGNNIDCFKESAKNLLKWYASSEILSALAAYESHPEVSQNCHELLHFIGRSEYLRVSAVPEALSLGSSICYAGYYHGVLEEYLLSQNFDGSSESFEKLNSSVTSLCGTESLFQTQMDYLQCLHGVGHAMMFAADGDVPESLKLCDNFADMKLANWCYSGVFMENATSSTNPNHPSQYLKKEDPLYPCSVLESKYLSTCYIVQSGYFGQLTNNDFAAMARLCDTVAKENRNYCYYGLGQQQTGYTDDLRVLGENCTASTNDDQMSVECIKGVVTGLVHKTNKYDSPIELCKSLPSLVSDACFLQILDQLQDFGANPEVSSVVCQNIQDKTKAAACAAAK